MVELLSTSIYGGKIDNPYDQSILKALISHLFHPESFNSAAYPLYTSTGALTLPDLHTYEEMLGFIQGLEDVTPPEWCGLSPQVLGLVKGEELRITL